MAVEFIMLFFSRRSWPPVIVTIPFFIMVLMATILIGWHYIIDWFGDLLVAGISMLISFKMARQLYAPWTFAWMDTDTETASRPDRST